MASAYPSLGGVYLWRGLGSTILLAPKAKTFNKKSFILGFVHASHMLSFLLAVRTGPAWVAPAILGGVPAVLWVHSKQKNRQVTAAVIIMAAAAVVFSWDSQGTIPPATLLYGTTAALLVAVRMHYASKWLTQYNPNTALMIAYITQFGIGVGMFVLGYDTTLVVWLVAGMVITGTVGHLALYKTASHCSPSIAAAISPLSVILTATGGVVLLGTQTPTLTQALTAAVWLTAGVFVATKAQNVHTKPNASTAHK